MGRGLTEWQVKPMQIGAVEEMMDRLKVY